jgi:hypothetical protein
MRERKTERETEDVGGGNKKIRKQEREEVTR